jgi:hypothetical protein
MLINQKHVKNYALYQAKALRPFHPFTRVSKNFLERVEAAVRQAVINEIKAHPSKGTTLQ